jgi:Carbon starvation protein CstA
MSALVWNGNELQTKLLWGAIAALGAVSLGIVALSRGEAVNAAWLVIAAVCIYCIAYRYYALFIANKVLGVNPVRQTPAVHHNDGLDYVPTNRYVLFGHHFAAIAGAGPLVGPVLAAQMGYLPGTLWILAGVVFAGAVQDMTVLFLSTRRTRRAGRSKGDRWACMPRAFFDGSLERAGPIGADIDAIREMTRRLGIRFLDLESSRARARKLVLEYRRPIGMIATSLLVRRCMTGDDISELLSGVVAAPASWVR